MIKKITPRMSNALQAGKTPRYFADLWLSVLNDTVDTQADFQASILQSNMDFTTRPGYAALALQSETISQTSRNTTAYVTNVFDAEGWQSFPLAGGRWIDSVVIWGWGDAGSITSDIVLSIYPFDKSAPIISQNISIAASFSGEKTVTFPNLYLDSGSYWIRVTTAGLHNLDGFVAGFQYQNTDVYANGQYDHFNVTEGGGWVLNRGDMYFKINMQKYQPSGYFRTKTLDLGAIPQNPGTFQMAYHLPVDATMTVNLYGSATGAFAGEETTILDVDDGQDLPAGLRYWQSRFDLASNAALDETPLIDMVEFLYPKDQLLLRENVQLFDVDRTITEFTPLLKPGSFSMSDLKVIERVSSGGSVTLEIEDTVPDVVQRVVSDSPLKNFRCALYLGADVPGFDRDDLLRFFIGIVDSVKVKPKYRSGTYSLSITAKNPILELKRKAPLPTSTGLVDFSVIGLNYDKTHVIDAMLDIMRAQAGIPARYINLDSFNGAKSSIGPAFIVRRSNAAGLPDTRIKSPEEVVKLLTPLAVIADGYIIVDEDSRITFVYHNENTAAEGDAWADEALVKAGLDAVPIEDVSEILLGYDDFLFNMSMLGCEWDGSGSDWKAFAKVYANIDSNSVEEFAPGKAQYLSPMEKNLIDASKWLGPESGYNGETIAQTLTARFTARHAYPPVRMKGCVLPLSEFTRTIGGVVKVWSKEFCKLGRRGIATSETKKFMIMSKKLDQGKARMIFDLLELT